MKTPTPLANIQITLANVELLDSVGEKLQLEFPHLWGDQMPTHSTIVGFLANDFLGRETKSPVTRTQTTGSTRGPRDASPGEPDGSASASTERGHVYALRGQDGRLRGTWHIPAYAECPGRAAFKVQHPEDDYALVDFQEVVRRRLKQCAFCSRYERGEL